MLVEGRNSQRSSAVCFLPEVHQHIKSTQNTHTRSPKVFHTCYQKRVSTICNCRAGKAMPTIESRWDVAP